MNTFKFLVALEKGKKSYLDISVREQQIFMESFGEPKDDYDRSYFQCRCYYHYFPWYSVALYWMVSFVAIPFFVFVAWIKGFFVKFHEHIDAIADVEQMPEILPECLTSQYNCSFSAWHVGLSLSTSDLLFVLSILTRRPFAALCNFKTIVKVAKYSTLVRRYAPKAIIVHNEYSYTSSLLTLYCEKREVRHINVMHGEKCYQIRDSFFRYHDCYVWSEYYSHLFIDLKAEPKQFIVAVPPSLKIDTELYINQNSYADYKYYLATYDEKKIKSIVASMSKFEKQGKSVKYRPHPRYSDVELLKHFVSEDNIEDPKRVGILESISSMGCAVSEFSTVLTQAYHSGKGIVIDDISDPEIFNKLREHRYIFASIDGISKLSMYNC